MYVGREPGQIVIRQGYDTFDENRDVDADYPHVNVELFADSSLTDNDLIGTIWRFVAGKIAARKAQP